MSASDLTGLLEHLADAVARRVADRLTERHGEQKSAPEHEPDFLSEAEVSRRIGLSRRTLQSWRAQGRGPKYTKTGRRVLYPAVELREFLRARSMLNGSRHPEISKT